LEELCLADGLNVGKEAASGLQFIATRSNFWQSLDTLSSPRDDVLGDGNAIEKVAGGSSSLGGSRRGRSSKKSLPHGNVLNYSSSTSIGKPPKGKDIRPGNMNKVLPPVGASAAQSAPAKSADEERNETAWKRVKGLTSAVKGEIRDKDGKPQDPVFLLKQARLFLHHVDSSDIASKDDILSEIFSNLGLLYCQLQQPAKGLLNHQKDLKISRKLRNREGEVRALLNIADAYDTMGEPKEASYYRNQADVVTGHREEQRQAMSKATGIFSEAQAPPPGVSMN